ncbi:amino acid/amide ABC transporter membrane protein 2, HAAT family [Rhizobiales bacterium GAS191]|nr:amino acid/amide ABC transporter membrane protein 2, HAAT family [Rhizobiales bacterium GAS191]SEC84056.1 amino acid/amide ABC transporter membrane protein 2, HAAT family [Rhizobiales bacterium GAS188]
MQEATVSTPAERLLPPHLARLAVPVLVFALLALAPLAGLAGSERYMLALVTRCMIFAIAAIGLDLALGCGGLVSFGHAAFIGIGAYAAGILTASGIEDAALVLGVALAASGLFALVTGAISLKTRGVHFIMITLAFGQMAYFVANSLKAYGGDDGLTLANRVTLFGQDTFGGTYIFYYAVLALLLVVYLLARAVIRSRFGRVLRGAKDNEIRMAAIGFNPYPFRLAAYVLSGMMAGLAGFLLAEQSEFVSPAFMTWQRSGDLIIMVMLGGVASLDGAILGALMVVLTEELLAGFTEHWRVIFGPFLVLVALFARGGLLGLMTGRRHG